jgi:hypothetical protein
MELESKQQREEAQRHDEDEAQHMPVMQQLASRHAILIEGSGCKGTKITSDDLNAVSRSPPAPFSSVLPACLQWCTTRLLRVFWGPKFCMNGRPKF